MSVNSKMTVLANEIRELSGTTTSKSIDAMTSDVDAANTEIAEQTELLEQIAAALEGKAGGGTVLPTLDNPAVAADILSGKEAIDGDGNVITGTIATRTSSNLTASGATVMVPSGYYASNTSKSVATATQATPSVNIDANGKITASATQSAGYVSAGTKTGTKQMTTQAAKTITPSTNSQTAVAKNVYTTGAVTVAAIPSNYEDVGTETTEYTSLNVELEAVINSLPEAGGGGGSVETCTLIVEDSLMGLVTLVYQNALGEAIEILSDPTTSAAGTYSVACGTLLYAQLTSSINYFISCVNLEKYANEVFVITAKAGEIARLIVTRQN